MKNTTLFVRDRYNPPALAVVSVVAECGFAASDGGIVSDGYDDGGAPDLNEWD